MHIVKQYQRLMVLSLCMTLPQTVNAVGGIDIQNGFLSLITAFWPLWITAAILVLVIAGFTLMTSQDENSLQKAKTTLISVLIGGILTTIIWVNPLGSGGPLGFIGIVYNGMAGSSIINTGDAIGFQVIGIAEWLSAMAVMLGILFIIVAVLRAVASLGDEAAYTAARYSLLHVIIGVVLIAGTYLIQLALFGSETGPGVVVSGDLSIEPNPLLGLIAAQLVIILHVITFIAVAILIYAGLRMIISFGREEDFTAAKSLALRVIVGLLVLIVSYSLVWIVATIFT